MRNSLIHAVAGLVATVGFVSAAHASATVDLIWQNSSTSSTSMVPLSSSITLNVILTAGPQGSQGAGVTVDYSAALGKLSVVGFTANPNMGAPGALLPLVLGMTTDTGSQVRNVNAAAFPPFVGAGLTSGQSWLLGTVTFLKASEDAGTFSINVVITGTDDILNLAGGVITGTSTLNSATISNPPIPEPGTVALLGLGLSGLALVGRRKG